MQGQTTSNVDLGEMQDKAVEGLKEARGTVEEFARTNPRIAIGIAVGIGFVLGGGLTPRILFGLGALAARTVARDYVRGQIASVTGGLLGGNEERAEAE
jgi:hypothetical protein